ncbi:MAG TPA: hypothetical protein VIK86_09470 [Candidatus Paceibacterota bacterium]
MKTKKFYLIQGINFQPGHRNLFLGFRSDPSAKIGLEMINAMYNGIVESCDSTSELFKGELRDLWGNAKITNFEISENELKFTKTYEKRPPIINIFTKKENGVWSGTFEGNDCGTGKTKCTVTEIDNTFFVS